MNRIVILSAACAMTALAPSVASAASVSATTPTAQLIGSLAAGQAYTVTASGIVVLCGSCNGVGPLSFNSDGTVATPAQAPYAAFNSGPKDYDPSISTSAYGLYGAGVFFGALYGNFTATPTSASDLFLIGYGTTIAAGAARTLYGVINDSNYGDNPASALTATLNRADVAGIPEPASWAMLLLGFGGVGYALRRRQQVTVRIRFA